ncbi:sugar phosphate isomerase/epimerase [Candidatus Bipolaricaulota bacterium]|nr:sugar phosphate isomerase/epimerase [Candidatus Bipolaricaulota bacterium]
MKLLASSLAYHPLAPDKALKKATALGYGGLEIMCDPPWHPRGWPPGLVRKLAATGALISLHAPIADVNLISPHPAARAFAEAELARTLTLAAELGAQGVTFHLGYRSTGVPYTPPWQEARAAIRRLSARAQGLGVQLQLENDPKSPYTFLWDLEQFEEFLIELGIPGTLDLGHAWTAHGEDTLKLLPRLAPLIHTVHLHDNHGQSDDHLPLGAGAIEVGRALDILAETADLFVVEQFSQADLGRSLDWLKSR